VRWPRLAAGSQPPTLHGATPVPPQWTSPAPTTPRPKPVMEKVAAAALGEMEIG